MQQSEPVPSNIAGTNSLSIRSAGHAVFAATMVFLGIVGLTKGQFTPTWSGVPKSFPAREMLAYLCAFVSLITGIGLVWRRTAVVAARVLLIYFVVWFALFRVPNFFRAPTGLNTWWSSADTAVMTAAVLVLYAWFVGDDNAQRPSTAAGSQGVRIARILFGLAMIPFGVAHFLNLSGTASLVPAWLPAHNAWAYFTGGAFIAAGVAVLTGVYARLASVLITLQLGLFTLIVWVPVVIAGPNDFQWAEFLDSVALTAAAWVVADSYHGAPWMAGRQR